MIFKVFFAILLLASTCSAQQEPTRLEEINSKIIGLQQEQKSLSASIAGLEKSSLTLSKDISTVQEAIKSNASELNALKDDSHNLTSEIADFSERINDLNSQSRARLRALYTLGGGQQMALRISTEGRANLGKLTKYISALRLNEIQALSELKRLTAEKESRMIQLRAKTSEVEGLKLKHEQHQDQLRRKLAELELNKTNLKKQKTSKSRILSELRAEALRLETVLSSLVAPPEPEKSALLANTPFKSVTQEIAQAGNGFPSQFLAPIVGTVVTRFGAKVSDGADQLMVSKGLGFVAKPGETVYAVTSGRVSFVGVLGSYGNVVILDHGKRSFSLYSQLESVSVGLGQQVADREALGQIGEVEAPKPFNLYFELRKEGKAIDPKPFLP